MLKSNPLRTGLDWLDKFFFVIQSICMYASVATVIFTVLMREIFKVSIVWGYEIACWFVIILLFLGMPHNLHYNANLSVTFVYDISPKVVQKILRVIHFVVELAVLIMMASGFKIWITKVGSGTLPASGFTNVLYYGVIGIGVAVSFVEMFAEIIDLFVKKEVVEEPVLEEHTLIEEFEEEALEEQNHTKFETYEEEEKK